MVVCKFFLQGNCRYGDSCRNEHPRNQPSQNRFAPLNQMGGGGRGRSGAFGSSAAKADQFGVTTDEIKLDLTHINNDGNRPEWPLSSYAPGKNPPRQLIEGPLEISPEEMRVQCYLARQAGKGDEYVNQENALLKQSQQQVQTILNDLEAAKNYVLDGVNHHPNRHDMEVKPNQNFPWVNKPTLGQPQAQTGGFGQTSAFGGGGGTADGFGQPSSLGASKPAFGAPTGMGQGSSFGQSTSLGGGSAFGQATPLGGAGGFGQPSKLGGGSTFGQTSTPGAASNPFGGAQKPATFGQASQPASGFGQSSQPSFGQSGFGQAAKPAFGAPTAPTSTFGQPTQPAQTSTFGQPSQPAQGSGFGATQAGESTFGQASTFGAAKANPFATAAQNAQQPAQPSTGGTAFGQPSTFGAASSSPFVTQNQQPQQQSTFGTSGFGAASKPATSSPFVTQNQTATAPSGFGAPSNNTAAGGFGSTNNQPAAGGFGAPSTNAPSAFGTQQPPTGPRQIPTTWKGQRVHQDDKTGLVYYEIPGNNPRDPTQKKKVRIWFPTGPPQMKDFSDAEAPEGTYEGQLGETLKSLYEFVKADGTGLFKDGVMPEIPPKREWVGWEF